MLPKEHGGWVLLLVPLATGFGAGGTFGTQGILFLLACLALFFAHHPLSLCAKAKNVDGLLGERFRRPLVWAAIYLSLACLFAAPLFFVYGLWKLLYVWACGIVILLFHLYQYAVREEQGYKSTISGATGLTLAAPGAYYVSTGTLDGHAVILWAVNALFFWGGILFVTMRITAKIRNQSTDRNTGAAITRRWGTEEGIVLAYHTGVACLAVLLGLWGYMPSAVTVIFIFMLVRASYGAVRGGAHLNIKKMGIQETLYSIAFGVVLIVTYHGR